ncbi:Predicted arabinose efflux permease, MFS family [Sphingobium sp. AP50]|uniref:spinster family MFS transporter n=1 Tax=Sphingobium sp. AP50 TaxID=1884369 RepID=UPI0008BB195A|nr:MFS transporter [Sphingobium sp. AP50]SEJ99074.1 Predicted arabinose efflux permease, MFS family [Sphingobium sp. AP50]
MKIEPSLRHGLTNNVSIASNMSTDKTDAGASRSILTSKAMWVLMFISALNFLDRQVINILAEPIKRELGLSDTQLGLMTGLAFAIFYSSLGIPIARFADRPHTNRAKIIAVSLAIWSAMTAACGLAQNFGQLLLARLCVGIGEAGCTPSAHSLISDLFPPAQRAAALAFYGIGMSLGLLVGLGAGGMIADAIGWRWTLLLLGLPGLLLSLIAWSVLPEPRQLAGDLRTGPARYGFLITARDIFRLPVYRNIVAALTVASFLTYGASAWQAIFLMRSYGLSIAVAGITLGIIGGIGTGIGTWIGGYLAQRAARKGSHHVLTGCLVALLLAFPLSVAGYLAPDWRVCAVLLFVAGLSAGMLYAPTFTCVQGIVPPSSRAAATALLLMIQNLIGLGAGPALFGLGSDLLAPHVGRESVRWILVASTFFLPLSAWLYWRAGKGLAAGTRD